MARGWESKSVEAQQDAAAEGRHQKSLPVSPDDVRKRTARATLMLARTRALSDLQQACAPAHKAMLQQAIADLDRQLKALEN